MCPTLSNGGWRKPSSPRSSGRQTFWQPWPLILSGLLLFGCASGLRPSSPSASIPPLRMMLQTGIITQGGQQIPGVIIRTDDFQVYLALLKYWCLLLGGTDEHCQVEITP